MGNFQKQYVLLNEKQKQAVDCIDGPVLVLAGPGTGKTQLLSMRVANILRKTDVLPNNILCLTFTDNAAREMRERLSRVIGQPAYHVSIHTFHSFGSEIINRYPDYFTNRQLLQQIDELGQYELLSEIFEELPHSNPLSTKIGDQFIHLKSTLSIISWLKQNALAPGELNKLISSNKKFVDSVSDKLADVFIGTPSPKKIKDYQILLNKIKKQINKEQVQTFGFPHYAKECSIELEKAINETDPSGRYATQITAWRNRWCKKDANGKHIFKDDGQSYRKMQALANIYQKMLDKISHHGLYDFDDMIIEAVHAIESNSELRLNLQEQYQYILVDEFQDTNKAQLRMLTGLGDNPVYENKPNIMAVGDDDQAIYAFQGAEVSNMAAFAKMYDESKMISLSDNYRSTADIIKVSFNIANRITDRLQSAINSDNKDIIAKAGHKRNELSHLSFSSELAQYGWISEEIEKLISKGFKPDSIAVLAPRHKYLERLMPYLGNRHIPVAYERRENILEAPMIKQLLTMAELIVAISENRQKDVDALFAQVLSYDFWGIADEDLINISLDCYNKHEHWLKVLSKHKDKKVKGITEWFLELARYSSLEPMEYILDRLIGTNPGEAKKATTQKLISPMKAYYFNPKTYEQATDNYLALLGQLSTLRHRLRQWKPNMMLYIKDFVEFSELYNSAKLKIIDTNPHTQTTNAVQVMTAYKSKGLEFDAVFVINAQDEIWGPTARKQNPSITLPKNLPIEPAGDNDNDKLRLLFVALSRAKHTLYITSYTHNLDNKLTPGLSFITGNQDMHPLLKPKAIDKPASFEAAEILSTDWAYRFRQIIADKKTLFEPILKNYKLSVTHLNNFTDVKDGGPDYFFMHNLLRFPESITPSAGYGDSIHKTLQWLHTELRKNDKLPKINDIQEYFSDLLSRKHLPEIDYKRLDNRGREALDFYLKNTRETLSSSDMVERGFNNEGVVINGANLSGKIDKLHLAEADRAEVVDFKTGKPAKSWQGKDEYEKIKLHKYKQQLLFYKLLVENSASFHNKLTVDKGLIDFIEPNEEGKREFPLELRIESSDVEEFKKLIEATWNRIMNLDLPDISKYPKNYKGIIQFEKDLISNN